jgi:Flp pilus assembly protein TadG
MRRAWLFRIRRAAVDLRGAAAVELALVLPLLAVLAAGVIQYGGQILAYQKMHNGVAAAALYVMRGGSGSSTIRSVALGAWRDQPSDASVSVSQYCSCASVVSSCSTLCSDSSYPQGYTTISASGSFAGPFASQSMSTIQVVRTQ